MKAYMANMQEHADFHPKLSDSIIRPMGMPLTTIETANPRDETDQSEIPAQDVNLNRPMLSAQSNRSRVKNTEEAEMEATQLQWITNQYISSAEGQKVDFDEGRP